MKRLLLTLPLLLSACTTPVDYLRCDAMFRAKARVEERPEMPPLILLLRQIC